MFGARATQRDEGARPEAKEDAKLTNTNLSEDKGNNTELIPYLRAADLRLPRDSRLPSDTIAETIYPLRLIMVSGSQTMSENTLKADHLCVLVHG